MSTATTRPPKVTPSYLSGALPQVNLLPPEVRAARGLVVTKRWLGATLLLVLVVSGLGYGVAVVLNQVAATEQAAAQDDAALLQVEEARYAEVPIVVSEITRGKAATTLGMAPEILWKGYLDSIAAVLPANVGITSFTVMQGTTTATAATPPDLLAAQGIASINFITDATTLPDNSNWLDALNSIPGFYAATFTSATLTADTSSAHYGVSSTVQVDLTAYSRRFTAEGN